MKRLITSIALLACMLTANAQQTVTTDSVFKGRIVNDELKVYIDMDFYKQAIVVPGQEFFGEMPGYFGDFKDSRKWLFTSAKLVNRNKANLEIINDYGSEDLEATLTYNPSDSTYTLQQGDGSNMKIARNRKWQKLPHSIVFKKKGF